MPARGHILDANTVALWRFDEGSWGNLIDAVGTRHLTASTSIEPVAGRVGGARLLTTTQRFSRVTDATLTSVLTTGSYTFEFWFNLRGVAPAGAINYTWNVSGNIFACIINSARTIQAYIGATPVNGVTGGLPITSTWQHIAIRVTVSGSSRTIDIFLNGKLHATGSLTPTFGTAGSLFLGQTSNTVGAAYDDARLSNVARTDAEIADSYARGAPFLTLNDIELPVRDGTAAAELVEVGETVRTFDGSIRKSRQSTKRHLTLETGWLAPADAEAWVNFARGVGWCWSFEEHLYSSNGRGPTAVTGSGASISSTQKKFGGFSALVASSSSVTFGLPLGSIYTIGFWRWSGSAWQHYLIRSDGARWQDGIRNDSLSIASIITITTSSVALISAQYHDNLFVLPYLVPNDWPAVWGKATSAFSSLPNLNAGGEAMGGVDAAVRGTVLEVKYAAAVDSSGVFRTNLQSLTLQLDEV